MGAWLVLGWGSSAMPVLSYLLLFAAAVFIGVTAGPLIERLFLRRVYGKEEEIQILLTFSILLILEDVIKLVWGVSPLFADKPYIYMGHVRLGGVDYAGYPFLLTGIAVVTGILLWLVVTRTRFGKVLISVITDREVSSALGVNVPRIYTLAFTLGAVFAALGGACPGSGRRSSSCPSPSSRSAGSGLSAARPSGPCWWAWRGPPPYTSSLSSTSSPST